MTYVDQIGGDHYQAELQHWDVMEKYDVDYLLATGTKYLMRWRKKGVPVIDLGKAASYFEKALVNRPGQGARRLVPQHALDRMYEANDTHDEDAAVISQVLASGSHDDIKEAFKEVSRMLAEVAL